MNKWTIVGLCLLLTGCQSGEYHYPESKNYSKESALQAPDNPLMEDYNRVKHRRAMPYNPHEPTHPSRNPTHT